MAREYRSRIPGKEIYAYKVYGGQIRRYIAKYVNDTKYHKLKFGAIKVIPWETLPSDLQQLPAFLRIKPANICIQPSPKEKEPLNGNLESTEPL